MCFLLRGAAAERRYYDFFSDHDQQIFLTFSVFSECSTVAIYIFEPAPVNTDVALSSSSDWHWKLSAERATGAASCIDV